jgi:hypothetical protein
MTIVTAEGEGRENVLDATVVAREQRIEVEERSAAPIASPSSRRVASSRYEQRKKNA